MKLRLSIILSLFFFTLIGSSQAQDITGKIPLFYQANNDYSQGEFKRAIDTYEDILESGIESGPLYYNLGNAYFKQGILGKAILNYLRAKSLMPDDADLNSNLDHARSMIKGGQVSAKEKFFRQISKKITAMFSLDKISLILLFVYLTVSILVIISMLIKKQILILRVVMIVSLVLLVISTTIFIEKFNQIIVDKHAVVIVAASDSKFEPTDQATTHFTLYEGESVVVLSEREGWVKIKRIDGKQGWIKRSVLEIV